MNILHLDKYTLRLIKDNALYLLAYILIPLVFIFSVLFFYNQYTKNAASINSLNSDNKGLKTKIDFIQYKGTLITSGMDINHLNQVFSQLVPDREDYFSILIGLSNLSTQSNFLITNYTVNIDRALPNRISISVEGQGDSTTFLNFLRNYNFGSGRLITIGKIEYSVETLSGSKIIVNFYSGKAETVPEDQIVFSPKDQQLLADIATKVQIQLAAPSEASQAAYPTKALPF